jgi:hypothetical protein
MMKRVILGVMLLSAVLALPALGGDLEELARQRIAQETGLAEDLIATLFVSEENAQFILTFIYINERTFDSRLKPELLEAIAPYRNEKAMLVLVTPARESYFNPLLITFTQDRISYRVELSAICRVNESFTVGAIPQGEVSAGVILLDKLNPGFTLPDEGLDVRKPFKIGYMSYATDFALSPGEPPSLGLGVSGEGSNLLQFLLFFLLNSLLFLLLGFLV